MEVSAKFYTPAALFKGRIAGTHYIWCCPNRGAGIDSLDKTYFSCLCRKSNHTSSVVQSQSTRYTDFAISTPSSAVKTGNFLTS